MSTYTYDNASRPVRRYYTFDFYSSTIYDTYSYNTNGLMSKMVPANGDNVIPEYNGLKQIDRVKVEHESSTSYTYYKDYFYTDVSDTQTSNLPNGVTYYSSNGTSSLLTFDYWYDNINRVTDEWKNSQTRTHYTYDNFGKLTGATQGSDTYSYSYDYLGNITGITKTVGGTTTTKSLTYDSTWKDRLVSVNGLSLEYDSTAPGLPTKYQNGNKQYNLSWDEQGNLSTSLTLTNTSTYTYFSGGLRSSKASGGVTHNYYYDGDRLIAETFGNKYILYYYDESDSIYSFRYYNGTSTSKYYLFKNLQGDVIEIRDYHNNLVATYSYDPWGNVNSIKNASGNVITDANHIANINPIRYRGYYYDTETGFYYLKSRYYDPTIGRFISGDSILIVDPQTYGLNLFAYCGNDPVNRVDTTGNSGTAIFGIGAAKDYIIPIAIIVLSFVAPGLAKTALEAIQSISIDFDIDVNININIGTITTNKSKEPTYYVRDAIKEKIAATDQVVPNPDYSAQYYGAYALTGYEDLFIITPAMDYLEALNWVWITAYQGKRFGKRFAWGLYTVNQIDAAIMAKGLGELIYLEPNPEYYPHYHVITDDSVGFYGYKYFHVWFGGYVL